MSKKDKHKRETDGAASIPDEAQAPECVEAEQLGEDEASEDTLAAMTRERDDLLARLQRLSADYVNYQKRAHRDLEAAREFANESLIKALLYVLDDMERALAAGRDNHSEDDPFVAGMQLVHDKMIETLGRFGLKTIEAEGLPFDPEFHSAMMQQPSEAHPPSTVLTEVVKGYQLKGRTIRPAGVVVTAAAPAGTGPDAPGQTPQDES